MHKDKAVLRDYARQMSLAYGHMRKHLDRLDKEGRWEIGDPFFDAAAKQLESICEYVVKIMSMDILESDQLIRNHSEIKWDQIHRLRQRLAHWYNESISPDFLRDQIFGTELISELMLVLEAEFPGPNI